jgi:hypothetical protein
MGVEAVDSSRFGAWLQIVGNLGLIIGLVLVGVQINQSNKIAMANLISTSFQETTDRLNSEMGENPASVRAKALMEPQNLTPEDVLVMTSYAQWHIVRMQRDALMEELGMYSDDGWRSQIVPTGMTIGATPVAREFLLNFYKGDPRWWIVKLQESATEAPKQGYKAFVEEYLSIAQSYAGGTLAE